MNPLYNMMMSGGLPQTNIQSMNPIQKMQFAMNAMNNPAGFIKSVFPDIPPSIQYDPNQILQYLQRTRNISNEDIQRAVNQRF